MKLSLRADLFIFFPTWTGGTRICYDPVIYFSTARRFFSFLNEKAAMVTENPSCCSHLLLATSLRALLPPRTLFERAVTSPARAAAEAIFSHCWATVRRPARSPEDEKFALCRSERKPYPQGA